MAEAEAVDDTATTVVAEAAEVCLDDTEILRQVQVDKMSSQRQQHAHREPALVRNLLRPKLRNRACPGGIQTTPRHLRDTRRLVTSGVCLEGGGTRHHTHHPHILAQAHPAQDVLLLLIASSFCLFCISFILEDASIVAFGCVEKKCAQGQEGKGLQGFCQSLHHRALQRVLRPAEAQAQHSHLSPAMIQHRLSKETQFS
jgi:hypothetical protein